MIRLKSSLQAATLALCGGLMTHYALASKPVLPQVSGHVTALASNEIIIVDGHRYLVAVASGAYKAMSSIHVGDAVSLILSGPLTSSASHVIVIQRSK